ncbi:aldo/keto reductase [Saxibacter everestensis]|uniref:Aldo/keto reductase n=1 Tax=Saxibacter everestensis TaxID=2909229 RepID=A0ABY8QRN3_9MICO|nr:aldo/keto reductase [Brevibacteriaceae bacterium ZFBP1038]
MTRLGGSDLDIFPLALGGNPFGWTADPVTSHGILDAFVAGGGNFIDTADVYSAWVDGNSGGESESIIGDWFAARGRRDDVILGTKVSAHPQFRGLGAGNIQAAADASLARLKTDYIDVYYAHFDDQDTPLTETVAAFQNLVSAGKIRYVALSNYSAERIDEWISIARGNGFDLPVALQPNYNLVNRAEFESTLRPVAEKHNLGVVPYYALASGFLTGKYRTADDLEGSARKSGAAAYLNEQGLRVVDELAEIAAGHSVELATVALAWLRAQSTIAAPLASVSKVDQLDAILASATLELTDEELGRLDQLSAELGN